MKEAGLKTAWHLLLVGAALFEYQTSTTRLRKFLCMACAGWHLAATIDDAKDFREARRYVGNP